MSRSGSIIKRTKSMSKRCIYGVTGPVRRVGLYLYIVSSISRLFSDMDSVVHFTREPRGASPVSFGSKFLGRLHEVQLGTSHHGSTKR